MLERVFAVARKETRELLRDPVYLGLAFVVPVVLMLLFGYGLTLDVKRIPILFLDLDRSASSRDYIDGHVNSEYFVLAGVISDRHAAARALRDGRARVVVEIPPDFARRITAQRPVAVGVTVDASFPARGEIAAGYLTAINTLYNQRLLDRFLDRSGWRPGVGRTDSLPVSMSYSVWYNPTLESKSFVVPGMMVIIQMLFPALLGALLIVREREVGTIFNLFCSPVRRWEIIAGKAAPYIGVVFFDYVILFAISIWLFEVRFIGSIWVVASGALLYSTCTIGIGLLISVLTRSQLAAMLITFLVTVTPAFNYSGFMAPVASQDAVGQFVARLVPATYFMDVLRGSYLKGLGFDFYWPQLAALGAYTVLIYVLAWAALRKRIG